jgi:hypothetical protein
LNGSEIEGDGGSGLTAGGNLSKAARRAKMDRPYMIALLEKNGLR